MKTGGSGSMCVETGVGKSLPRAGWLTVLGSGQPGLCSNSSVLPLCYENSQTICKRWVWLCSNSVVYMDTEFSVMKYLKFRHPASPCLKL